MALTKEQFSNLRQKGLSVEQIVSFERGDKPRMRNNGTFFVDENEQDRKNKIERYQLEAQQATEESRKANSFLGKLGNFGKAMVGTIANSEVGLGESIAKIMNVDSKSTQALQTGQEQRTGIQANLLKRIREKEDRQEDATALKQAYNRLVGDPNAKVNDRLLGEATAMPSTAKVVGQIGGTALDLLTAGTYGKATKGMQTGQRFVQGGNAVKSIATGAGVPELGQLATQKAGGLFTKKGLGNIATGTGIGYASDVTQGLQGARGEEREGAKAFIPGAGTAIGFALPFVSESAQSLKNRKTDNPIISKRRSTLDDIEKKYVKVGKAFSQADSKGVDARSILSETNLLNGAVDEDGLISAERALQNFDELVAPYEGKVREAIQSEGAKLRIADIASAMDDFVAKTDLQGEAYEQLNSSLLRDLKGLQNKYGDNIPVEALHDLKIFRGNANNYLDSGKNAVNKEATRLFKELVENNVRSLDVQSYNGELSKLYSVRDVIEALDKKGVKGRRLGKYFSTLVGTGVGASSGNPLLAILGAEIGSRTQGKILERSLGGNIQKGMDVPSDLTNMLINKVPRKDVIPPVVIPKAKAPNTLDLQSSNKLGNLNTSQSTTINNTRKGIPNTVIPVRESSSVAPRQFERAEVLSDADRAIETKAFTRIENSEDELIERYLSEHGKVVNTDEFRPLFKEDGYAGYNSASVQEPSSYLSKKVYSKLLQENPEPYVTFLAGGSGTGKTSAVKNLPEVSNVISKSAVLLDSNLSSYNSAIKKINEALEAGKRPVITYVYRDPYDSMENGVVKRMLSNPDEGGRLVPTKVVAGNHIDSWEVAKRLHDEGYAVQFIDNSLGFGNAKIVSKEDLASKIKYTTKEELTEEFNDIIRKLYETKENGQRKITKEQLEGYTN